MHFGWMVVQSIVKISTLLRPVKEQLFYQLHAPVNLSSPLRSSLPTSTQSAYSMHHTLRIPLPVHLFYGSTQNWEGIILKKTIIGYFTTTEFPRHVHDILVQQRQEK